MPTLGIDAANEEWIETTDDDIAVFSKARHASRAASSPPIVSSVYYYHVDPNGCPTRLTDASGQVRWSASYEAWGGIVGQQQDGIDNPLRLQGQYYDAETGLHYNRYRYYDSDIGSFIGQDPIGLLGGLNPYQFAANTLGWSDPLGLWAFYELISNGNAVYYGITDRSVQTRLLEHARDGRVFDSVRYVDNLPDRVSARNLEGSALHHAQGNSQITNKIRLDGGFYHSYDPIKLAAGRTMLTMSDIEAKLSAGTTASVDSKGRIKCPKQ